MPTREQIAANKITDEHLQPHLRKRRGGGGKTVISTTTTTVNSLQWQGIAAVDIASNKLVSIDANNQYILADAVGAPAIGIAKDGGNTGETITIIDDAIISYTIGANVGDDLWLSNVGDILASTPAEPLPANTIFQKIGFVVDTNRVRIKINNPFYIE